MMNQRMRKTSQSRASGNWKKLLSVIALCGVIVILAKNQDWVRAVVKQQPTLYRIAQKAKGGIDSRLSHWRQKMKPARKPLTSATIAVDASKTIERYEKFWGGIGSDYFYSGVTLPQNQALFELVAQANEKRQVFTYYRAHNMFSDRDTPGGDPCGGKVYREDEQGHPIYNWERVDQVFDAILQAKLKPIVEFGFMPEALTSNPNKQGDWHLANVAPPKDYRRWRNLVYETVKHLAERYGEHEIQSWYFEVWNEPDLFEHFWVEDPQQPGQTYLSEYLKLYDVTTEGALAAHNQIKIGGPAIAGWPYVLEGLIRHTSSRQGSAPGRLDFISFHRYGDIDENIIEPSRQLIKKALAVDAKKIEQIPFLLTEFGPTTQSRDQWKNSSYVAAWVCQAVDRFFELGEKKGHSFRPAAMVFWSSVGDNFRDGEGMIASTVGPNPRHLVKGPVFNAYDALSYLGTERVSLTGTSYGDEVHGIATKHGNDAIEILLYRITDYWNSAADSIPMKLDVLNLPFTDFFIQQFAIDEQHSNAYSVWKKMGSTAQLSPAQIAQLQQQDDLDLMAAVTQHRAEGHRGFTTTFNMAGNSVILLVLTKRTDLVPPRPPQEFRATTLDFRAASLQWQPPAPASDGDVATAYCLYRGDSLLTVTDAVRYDDMQLADGTTYQYAVYAIDDQGNRSDQAAIIAVRTPRDETPPQLVGMNILNLMTLELDFSEPLAVPAALEVDNYRIDNGIQIKSVELRDNGKRVKLTTTPFQKEQAYRLQIVQLSDRANHPNSVNGLIIPYKFELKFRDEFNFDSVAGYTCRHVWQDGGQGRVYFDAAKKALAVSTGDDVGESIAHDVPETSSGIVEMDFLPLAFYPTGGKFLLRLKQSDVTYYEISATCGYGAGYVKKVLQNATVDSTSLISEYQQKILHRIKIDFSPGAVFFTGFANAEKIDQDRYPIQVRNVEIQLLQQDAFIDNIFYQGR